MRMRRVLWSAGLLVAVGLGAGCAHDEAKQARSQCEQVGEALAEKARFADQLSLLSQEQIAHELPCRSPRTPRCGNSPRS